MRQGREGVRSEGNSALLLQVIYVPPPAAASAVMEAIEAEIPLMLWQMPCRIIKS